MSKLRELKKSLLLKVTDNFGINITKYLLVVPKDFQSWLDSVPSYYSLGSQIIGSETLREKNIDNEDYKNWQELVTLSNTLMKIRSNAVVFEYDLQDTKFIQSVMSDLVLDDWLFPHGISDITEHIPFVPPNIINISIDDSDYLFYIYRINEAKAILSKGNFDHTNAIKVEINRGQGVKTILELTPRLGKQTILKIRHNSLSGVVNYEYGNDPSLALIAGFTEVAKNNYTTGFTYSRINEVLDSLGISEKLNAGKSKKYDDFNRAIRERFNHMQLQSTNNANEEQVKESLVKILKEVFKQSTKQFYIHLS